MNTISTNPIFTCNDQAASLTPVVRALHHASAQPSATVLFISGWSQVQGEKTASRIAAQLRKPLYRVSLGGVTSKYIGETEKNLKRAFDQAAQLGWVLLFDEADALFGKRTEVQDSHDRYANIETSYLSDHLQRHRGVVMILGRNPHSATLRKYYPQRITLKPRARTSRK
ncbi:MAG: AAA family ATPase [Cyclobacteriaceae bacterium]